MSNHPNHAHWITLLAAYPEIFDSDVLLYQPTSTFQIHSFKLATSKMFTVHRTWKNDRKSFLTTIKVKLKKNRYPIFVKLKILIQIALHSMICWGDGVIRDVKSEQDIAIL